MEVTSKAANGCKVIRESIYELKRNTVQWGLMYTDASFPD